MRILQVVPYFLPAYAFGGPVKVAYQISKELTKRGHEVVVYTTDAKDPDSRLNVESVRNIDARARKKKKRGALIWEDVKSTKDDPRMVLWEG